jgi:hypothetical protein
MIVPGASACVSVLSCCRNVTSRFQAAALVRDPLPVRARVIEVQHRGDVDAETVEADPSRVQRYRQQEAADPLRL